MDLFKKKDKDNVISKEDLEKQIKAMEKLSNIFMTSPILRAQGMGRSEKMASVLKSYKCIFAYFYSDEFKYGRVDSLLSQDEKLRYEMISIGVQNPTKRAAFLRDLPTNWQDVLKVISLIRIAEPVEINLISSEIDDIGKSMSLLSRL